MQIKESDGLGGHLIFVELLREGGRREIAKSRLFADAVVKDFNIFRDDAFRFLSCRETCNDPPKVAQVMRLRGSC